MNVPVVWYAARGYWDQGILEDFFAGELWPLDGMTFEHHLVNAEGDWKWPDIAVCPGGVVVIPARSHVEHLGAINAALSTFAWAVVIVNGDEENVFPWQEIDEQATIVRQTPIIVDGEPFSDTRSSLIFGHGYPPGTHEMVRDASPEWPYKSIDVYFAGQITHSRRIDMTNALLRLAEDTVRVRPTMSFADTDRNALPRDKYIEEMVMAKVAPCPSGPATVDSFRLYEALEAGCVPILDARTPVRGQRSYWRNLLGYDDPPFPVIDDWRSAPTIIETALASWPANANRTLAWWMGKKRDLAHDLQEIIALDAPAPTIPLSWSRPITVLVSTSPIPSHPSTAIISETLESIRERLPDAEIIVMIDGVRDEQADRLRDYEQYKRQLIWSCHMGRGILPIVFDEHHHQALMTRLALNEVHTDIILFVEHDTPLVGDIDFGGCVAAIRSGQANWIKFHQEAAILDEHQHLMVDAVVREVCGVPLLKTMQWSQRPHLASTQFYREVMARNFGRESRTMIEDQLHGVVEHAWRTEDVAGWERWRMFIYAPPGDIKRSTHLNGRGDDSKFDMKFEYDDENDRPAGSAYPTSKRID